MHRPRRGFKIVDAALVCRALVCVVMICVAKLAQAQPIAVPSTEDPVESAPLRFGWIALDPRIGLTNVGVDTNVFNTEGGGEQDFTFALTPGTQLFMRTGKGLLTVDAQAEFVYFNRFDSERSVNTSASGLYQLRFNRMQPYMSVSTLNTRQRPGYEIDARARHYETDFHVGNELRVASKSMVTADYRHLNYSFAGDEVFAGRPLNQELNRTLNSVALGWRQRLTALTTWVTRVSHESERFVFEDTRNSDSFRFTSGFDLGRFALIRGSAYVGFRTLRAAAGGELPSFSGATADIDVAYTAPTQTRFSVAINRDVQYSYERATPYYLQTGWTATLTQRVFGPWDVQASGGRDRLSYQSRNAASVRRDFIGRVGGGIGYALGDQVRAGFDVISFYRSSDLPGREYGGVRAGLSIMYGY
jgi:hypothetical protein